MKEPAVVVLDASVLVAAAGSSTGGSATAISLIHGSIRYRAAVSAQILDEAQRNVEWKLSDTAVARFLFLLRELNPMMVHMPSDQRLLDIPTSVAEKYHHVIAACLAAGAAICLTLDRRHLLSRELQRWATERGLRFMTPGQFLDEERSRDVPSTPDA